MTEKDLPLRIIQITDCHLFNQANRELVGMNTDASLEQVLGLIQHNYSHSDIDLILVTGDLAQDGSVEAYQNLYARLEQFNVPFYWIPGNHDLRSSMVKAVKCTETLSSRIIKNNWQVLMLDSTESGQVHGNLKEVELLRLESQLMENPQLNTIVCLHHQPVSVGCEWVDRIGLKNNEEFLYIIDRFEHIKAVLWGHIHQSFNLLRGNKQFLATPSTCVQFEPKTTGFSIDSCLPGYRWLECYPDGRIRTEVVRITDNSIQVDRTAQGY